MKQCPSCNTPNEDAALFCEKCGAQMTQAAPTAQPAAPAFVAGAKAVDGFHRGYANTLKIVAYILIGLSAFATLITLTVIGEGALAFFLGLIGAALVAFIMWFVTMYKVKMFDLTSKNAMINSMILEELKKNNK